MFHLPVTNLYKNNALLKNSKLLLSVPIPLLFPISRYGKDHEQFAMAELNGILAESGQRVEEVRSITHRCRWCYLPALLSAASTWTRPSAGWRPRRTVWWVARPWWRSSARWRARPRGWTGWRTTTTPSVCSQTSSRVLFSITYCRRYLTSVSRRTAAEEESQLLLPDPGADAHY